jgi:hypothetical protein
MPNEQTRGYLYRVGVAVVPVLTAYGLLNERDAVVWLGLLGSVLGIGLAAMNTSTKVVESDSQ